jgi:hypothetical protein
MPHLAYAHVLSQINCGLFQTAQPIGRYASVKAVCPQSVRLTIQQAGPKLSTYNAGAPMTVPASVRFAHRSRLLMIRTVSQIQKAAKATPRAGSRMAMSRL